MFWWNLALLRTLNNLSQAGLAREAGLHQTTVSRYESGARPHDLADISKLAAALNVDPAIFEADAIRITRRGVVSVEPATRRHR